PPALLSVLDKMMAKDRDRRYQTPAEVAEALRPFAAASPSKPRRRWRALVAAAFLAAVVLLAGAVIYVQTDKGEFEISTSDANIAVMISAKGVKIRDQSSNREYLLTSATQDVRTGRYIVVELPDGTEIEGENSFTVKRGGRAIATVRLRADGDHQRIGETDRGLLPGRSDEQNIQGAWKGVAAEVSGQPVPKEFLDAVRPTITFLPGKMVARPNPTVPISKEFLDAAMGKGLVPREAATVLKNGLEGVYHLDPARSPRAIDIAMLGELRRTGLGIYSLDGDTLKLCMSLNPDRVDERPKEFATRPGGLQVMITLKRQSTEPQPAAVAERKAAEYVLSIGGAIRANDQERDLKTVAELPRGPFRLTHVFLTANHQVSDAGLANFTGCRDLTLLYLGKTKVTDAGLAVFKDCWNLADLELADTKVSDAGLVHFRGCKGLRHLDLDGCVNIGDAGLTSFKDCHKLRSLYLFDTHVTNAGLAFLKDCNNLDTVGLGETQIGDAGIAHLHSCKKLKILWVNTTHITDRGLAFLAGCTSLVTLSLGDTLVSDEGLTHIQRCKSLDTLDLTATKITDAGLKRLYPLTNLRDLRLGMTSVTPAGIDELKKALPQCKIRWQP
ncbi:MAG TPA: TIGR03067 domain-containing protein, partial [Gemmataceae bacterium]|nr:TIGR03067 domain-containing protein [Gemmataceae bacterium]